MTDPIDRKPKSPFAGRSAASLTGDELQTLASQSFAAASRAAAMEGFAVPGFTEENALYHSDEAKPQARSARDLTAADLATLSSRAFSEAARQAKAKGLAVPGYADGKVVYGLDEDRYIERLREERATDRALPTAIEPEDVSKPARSS